MLARAVERVLRWSLQAWRELSVDAKVVGAVAVANWLLLFGSHTTVAATHDVPLWQLFPFGADVAFLMACGALAATYPLRDRRSGSSFTTRDRAIHLAAIVVAFVIVPAVASLVLRETGRPYTYIHDGALMVEEAARKLLHGMNPYVADYLDTPMFYWPMINNPALYHLTYFPFMFLVTVPFVWLFDHVGIFWDQRYLYLPAYVATLCVVPFLIPRRGEPPHPLGVHDGDMRARLALTAIVALNPQLFPFVVEGRNDFFVLLPLFGAVLLLQRERRTLASLAFAVAGAAKLHALFILPFVAVYLVATRRPRTVGEAWSALWRPAWPAALVLAATFVPFLVNDFAAFYDDVVRYNAGGAAWTYPISGMGFSALLLALGVIEYRQADFPFAAVEIAVAAPIAAWWLVRLWRRPTIATLLSGYALALLAFLFFGRYFQGNYLGFILAIASPVPFLAVRPAREQRRSRRVRDVVRARGSLRPKPAVQPVPLTAGLRGASPAPPSGTPAAPPPTDPVLEPSLEPAPVVATSAD
ncbi:MAG: DUF2029 domain-containing protein [Chloroflexi bacterium]|nr:MAG: DUF2029 domain-containing protein [Chloroflexota bacterium]